MATVVRTARPDDIPACGKAMYEAFRDIAERHNFPPDFPSAETAGGLLGMMLVIGVWSARFGGTTSSDLAVAS